MINITIIFRILIIGFSWMFRPLDTYVSCPLECICLSQTEILCNTGGLNRIPLRTLPSSVENLSLTKNNFTIIKPDSFTGLRALKKLSLDTNNITRVKQFAFRGLPRLQELSIQNNPLKTVSQFAFAGLQNLSAIFLSNNQIVRIEGNAFAGTSNVNLILLTSNPLTRIETSAFSGLTNVGHLLLPSGIREIEPDAFFGMENVGLLKLSYMDLKELQAYTFRGLTGVQFLTLQDSDLGVICADAFNGLNQVGLLHLLNNKIDAIEELNITYTQQIKHLKLEGNHLLEMPEPNTIILDGVDVLTVDRNHFPCGCHIHTLLDSPLANGTYQNAEFLTKNYCISPLEVNGKPMISLDIDAIGRCQEQVTKGNLESGASSAFGHFSNYKLYTYLAQNLHLLISMPMLNLLQNAMQKLSTFWYELRASHQENNKNTKSITHKINKLKLQNNSTVCCKLHREGICRAAETISNATKQQQQTYCFKSIVHCVSNEVEGNQRIMKVEKAENTKILCRTADNNRQRNVEIEYAQRANIDHNNKTFLYHKYPCHNQVMLYMQQQQHRCLKAEAYKQYHSDHYHPLSHHHTYNINTNRSQSQELTSPSTPFVEKSIYLKLTFTLGIYSVYLMVSCLYPYQIELQR